MSYSLWPHILQCARLPCPLPTQTACLNMSIKSVMHPTISPSVTPFSSCLQSFPASGSFPMSQFFESDGQSIRASASVLPVNIQEEVLPVNINFLYDWLVWSPCCPRDSQESSSTPQFKSINFLELSFLYSPRLTSMHDYCMVHWVKRGGIPDASFLSGCFQAEENDTMASTTNSQIIVCHLTLLQKLYLQKCKA